MFLSNDLDKHCLNLFTEFACCFSRLDTAMIFRRKTIAYDKGKLAVRQGRKAVSLSKAVFYGI